MAKPATLPEWATNANFASPGDPWDGDPTKVAPPAGKIAEGWEPTEEPPAEFFNYWQNLVGEWTDYLDTETDAQDLRIADIESRIVADEWTYPTPKTRTVIVMPSSLVEFEGAGNDPYFWDPTAAEYLQQQRASAALKLDLNAWLPKNCVFTQARVWIQPGNARPVQTTNPGDNGRMYSGIYQLVTGFGVVPPTLSWNLIGFGTPSVEDDGTTNAQLLTMSGFAFTPAKTTAGLELVVYSGSTFVGTPDRIGPVELTFDDYGPRND